MVDVKHSVVLATRVHRIHVARWMIIAVIGPAGLAAVFFGTWTHVLLCIVAMQLLVNLLGIVEGKTRAALAREVTDVCEGP